MTVTAFIGITGSCQGEIVSATLQPLLQSEHLTAIIYDLVVLYRPVFFPLSATLKTSAHPHVAQPLLIISSVSSNLSNSHSDYSL